MYLPCSWATSLYPLGTRYNIFSLSPARSFFPIATTTNGSSPNDLLPEAQNKEESFFLKKIFFFSPQEAMQSVKKL